MYFTMLRDVYLISWFRYMAPPPPSPYDPYAGYPVAPVPMPTPAPIAAPSSYVPVQVKWFNLLINGDLVFTFT